MSLVSAIPFPWVLLAAQLSVLGAAAFTKSSSSIRYVAVAFMTAIACYFHLTVHEHMNNRLWKTFPAGIVIGAVLTAIERLLISKWNYEAGGAEEYRKKVTLNGSTTTRAKFPAPYEPASSRLWFTLDTAFSPHGVGHPWQVKNVPHFSSKDPSYVPTRQSFLVRRLALIALCCIIYDVSAAQPPPEERLVSATKQSFFSRIGDITREELIFRIVCTVGFWIGSAAVLNLFTNTYAFLVVSLGISEPAAWPPSFDSPTEAYSVRQFWG